MLGFLSWRTASSEQQLRAVERERAEAVAERLLQRAPASAAAFTAVPAEQRAVRRADGTFDVTDVAWLDVADSPLDHDFVVEDRLARAAVAEASAAGVPGAVAEFQALLAATLPLAQRLDVLLAAAWLRQRHPEATQELTVPEDEAERLLAALHPADLARPARARALASALRLAAARHPNSPTVPPGADALVPWLPPDVFASLSDGARWSEVHQERVRRRRWLHDVRAAWQAAEASASGAAPPAPGSAAVGNLAASATARLVAASAQQLLWSQPRPEGGHDVALLTPAQLVESLAQAGRDAALPELPPPFGFDVAADTSSAPLGVPGLLGVVDRSDRADEPVWLRPLLLVALALGLGTAIAVAVLLQLRAARREVALARTQSEFLTTVTHELKTPLAGIRLLGEMLAEGRAHGREQDYYRMLAGEAERLSQLIQNVLDLGRIERGERAYDLRSHDVGELVRSTLAWFTPLARQDGLVVTEVGPPTPCRATLDRDAFVQALVAVLDNARKYGAGGGRIEVGVERSDGAVLVAVRDHGPGVPEAERERVFERFVRGSAHQHGSTPGVGIGLYLARTIVRRLGGELAVASAAAAAATFSRLGASEGGVVDAEASARGDRPNGGPGACFVFRLPTENPA